MLQIVNHTRLAAGLSLGLDPWGRELLTVVAKGAFGLPASGGAPWPAEEPAVVLAADVHHGDPAASSVRHPADLVLGKRGTDVVLVGSAHAPGGRPVHRLEASLRVGPLARGVVVTGDRAWAARGYGTGFETTPPARFATMPLLYERAYGGRDDGAEGGATWDERNPVGTGFRTRAEGVEGTPVPNVEDPAHLVADWRDRPPVAGFGAIDGAWAPRRRHAGTYDARWQRTQAPLLPTDFDVRYFHVAAPGLTAEGFLRGRAEVELVNLTPGPDVQAGGATRRAFELPIAEVAMAFRIGDATTRHRAELWTVLLEPDRGIVTLAWGCTVPVGKQPALAYEVAVTVDGAMRGALAAAAC